MIWTDNFQSEVYHTNLVFYLKQKPKIFSAYIGSILKLLLPHNRHHIQLYHLGWVKLCWRGHSNFLWTDN